MQSSSRACGNCLLPLARISGRITRITVVPAALCGKAFFSLISVRVLLSVHFLFSFISFYLISCPTQLLTEIRTQCFFIKLFLSLLCAFSSTHHLCIFVRDLSNDESKRGGGHLIYYSSGHLGLLTMLYWKNIFTL